MVSPLCNFCCCSREQNLNFTWYIIAVQKQPFICLHVSWAWIFLDPILTQPLSILSLLSGWYFTSDTWRIHVSVPDIHVSVVSTHQYLLWASLVCLTWIRWTDAGLMMSSFLLFLRVSHHRLWWVAFVLLVYTAAPPTAMAAAAAAKRVMMMKLLRRNICFVRYFALCLALIQELLIIPKSIPRDLI